MRSKKEMEKMRLIEARDLSLSEWLQFLDAPPKDAIFVDYQFPSDRHRDEYIDGIESRAEAEVIGLVRHFLVPSCTLGTDRSTFDYYIHCGKKNPETFRKMKEREFIRRLLRSFGPNNPPPWEGITWVIDLLPHFPGQAIQTLHAYLLAHASWLPDGRLAGLSDTTELIRARFIGRPETTDDRRAQLLGLDPRDFECVVERLYSALEYDTSLTPSHGDGGRDVLARQVAPARREDIRIECKRYSRPVGVEQVRRLLGVVSSEKATKGVLVTTSTFTRGARAFAETNPRIELVPGDALVLLLNEHLGARWPLQLERIITESVRANDIATPPNKVLQRTVAFGARR